MPRPRFSRAVALVITLAAALPVRGQEREVPADPADVATIDGIVSAFYEVVSGGPGEPRQWARDATLYYPGTVFTIADDSPEGVGVRTVTPREFAEESDRFLVESGFGEREIRREARRFGRIAQIWSTYEWTTADGRTGRGINGIHLFHDGERWWITHATWDNEGVERAIPPEFLPDE